MSSRRLPTWLWSQPKCQKWASKASQSESFLGLCRVEGLITWDLHWMAFPQHLGMALTARLL